MPLLQNASVEQLRRLLEFFPSSALKAEWPGLKGEKKDTVCELAAKTGHDRIKKFAIQNFAHCRQHVLLLQKPEKLPDLTVVFPAPESLGSSNGVQFYMASVPYTIYLLSPMEEVTLDVLWPISIEVRDSVVIVRTFVLERDPANYTGRTAIKATRDVDDKKISQDLLNLGVLPLDINKGVKALWESKYMDAFRSSFKKSKSTSTEVMDGELG